MADSTLFFAVCSSNPSSIASLATRNASHLQDPFPSVVSVCYTVIVVEVTADKVRIGFGGAGLEVGCFQVVFG